MSIIDLIGDLLTDNNTKIEELKILKDEFEKKGYTHLYQIPDCPQKKRWIELMARLGLDASDPVDKAKKVKDLGDLKLLEEK